MGMMRCPNCQSQIKKPGNPVAIVLGILGFLFFGGIFMVVICLAAIAAIGASANEEFERVSNELQAEAASEVSFNDLELAPAPSTESISIE